MTQIRQTNDSQAHPISINFKPDSRDRHNFDLPNSLDTNASSIFDHMTVSDASSLPSDTEDAHDFEHKSPSHPPRVSSKTYMHQATETIEEDPDEDSENGSDGCSDSQCSAVQPSVLVTKAAESTSRPNTPLNLRLDTVNLNGGDKAKSSQLLSAPSATSAKSGNGDARRGVSSSVSPVSGATGPSTPQSTKKEKTLFTFAKLKRSTSSGLLNGEQKLVPSKVKESIKNVFSNHNPAPANIVKTPPGSKPSSAPGTPLVVPVEPASIPSKSQGNEPPFAGPRRVSSVGANMMLNVGAKPTAQDDTHVLPANAGHKAGIPRSSTEPPVRPGLRRARTLKECGITNRGKQAGKGATSTVTRCSSHGKLVALKTFKKPNMSESDEDFKRRIDGEFDIAHMLHHPNVIETMELVWDDNRHNWAETMEWCGGGDLFSIIKMGNMGRLERNCCFKQLVRGVAYMHSMGVAHRDIKPENLLLNEDGHLKITDFGVSDFVEKDNVHRKCHGKSGSEPYMAPEMHLQEEYEGFPLDIWACGVVYVCLWFGGGLWSKAVKGDPGFDKYLAALKESDDKKVKKEAKSADRTEVADEALKQLDDTLKAEDDAKLESATGVEGSIKLESDYTVSRTSSVLSMKFSSPTGSPPDGHSAPGSPVPSGESPLPPLERKMSGLTMGSARPPAPQRTPSTKQTKPADPVQSPLPIGKSAGAAKVEAYVPVPHYRVFEEFHPLQKRLIYRILDPNPETRITAAEILKDPFFKEIQCCCLDPDQLSRVQSGTFDASKSLKKPMPVKHHHPNHLITSGKNIITKK